MQTVLKFLSCIADDSSLLGFHAVLLGDLFPTFCKIVVRSSSRVKQYKETFLELFDLEDEDTTNGVQTRCYKILNVLYKGGSSIGI
jgi:hypothetical protein